MHSEQYVRDVLTGPNLHIEPGLDLLEFGETQATDISEVMSAGSISRHNFADIHGTFAFSLSRELRWGVDRVRPWVKLSDETVGATPILVYLGVYVPITPKYAVGPSVPQFEVTAYDKLYFLDRPVGRTYSVPEGSDILQAVKDTIASAGFPNQTLLALSVFINPLPSTKTWPLVALNEQGSQETASTTWLNVVNELLNVAGYEPLYTDENGKFRSNPIMRAIDRSPEYTFSTINNDRIVADEVEVDTDRFFAPNSWKFIRRNMPEGQLASQANGNIFVERNQTDGDTSITATGIEWWRVEFVDVESPESLAAVARREVDNDRRIERVFTVDTAPFPFFGHQDVYILDDPRFGGDVRVQEASVDFDLFGADTKHTWEAVT